MPKVLLDLRMVQGRLHGIARYALELARRLPALAPTWRFTALVGPKGLPSDLGELTPDLPQQRCAAGFLSPLEQVALAAALAKSGCDLFHATSFSVPALWPGRLVATLHDANHLALPHLYGPGRTAYYRLVVGPRARRAAALLTVSEFSREELARHLGLSPYRFQVIYPGVNPAFRPALEQERAELRQRLQLPSRYFVAVGNPKPHKNLARLVEVARALPVPLVLVAGPNAARELGFPDSTRALDSVSDEALAQLYSGATGLLLPSLYEGFGLPAVEAMACGCPVVSSNTGALPEVVGDAGLFAPPQSTEAWTEQALLLLRDPRLRDALVEKGRARAERYSWDACARRTLAVYERVLG